jgi:Ni,Fe-hydrogenase maturation factor
VEVSHYSESVQVIACHQLTPELVDPVSRAELVVFIDAAETGRPGEIHIAEVQPEVDSGAFTHNVSPASLLAAAMTCTASPRGCSFHHGGSIMAKPFRQRRKLPQCGHHH